MESFFDPFLCLVWEKEEEHNVTFPLSHIEAMSSMTVIDSLLLIMDLNSGRLTGISDHAYQKNQRTYGVYDHLETAYWYLKESKNSLLYECSKHGAVRILEEDALASVFIIWDDNYLFSKDKRRYE